ncbi:PaaI family thioesterase [Alicyclobacillus sp. SO9]|uniref:PaaI family thioesterase n=1 Tax=Alicyclobacillus sp. SO9 TaxID=2665646 RepID=UPI0018E835F4|nr:PaaI family thioesterase [Alicyclobacillus sp. SO9]QQE78859.1 PaaI family thioesterase [Alicyclobacillus sp. SO9]
MGTSNCFVCGPENPFGLHMHFHQKDEKAVAEFICEPRHCGWPGIQHGGITSSIFDEACAYVPFFRGLVAMTAELKVNYSNPIHEGEKVTVTAWPIRTTKRLLSVQAEITDTNGVVRARAEAKMMVLTDRQMEQAGMAESPI